MVNVYILDVKALKSKEKYEKYYKELSIYRKKRIETFRFEKDKLLCLGAGVLLDYGLKELGYREKSVEIESNRYNKPYLKTDEKIYYNISHSGEYAICVFSDTEIGVDIEYIGQYNISIAKRFFCESELAFVNQYNGKAFDKAFCRMWCLKESFIKAIGKGLCIPLDSFEINIASEVTVNQKENDNIYNFHELTLLQGYKISVCTTYDKLSTITEIMGL